jgi:ABC-type nitrate/sulfonate/bicarbonate transport system permease component
VRRESIHRLLPFVLSLAAGMALWEIVGRHTSAAFMVPLSETIHRFWQLAASGQLGTQFLDSATLFATGFALALLVGMVAAEFFLSSTGLGQLIMTATQNFDTGGVFAIILVIGLIGVGLMRFGLYIETYFARWRD